MRIRRFKSTLVLGILLVAFQSFASQDLTLEDLRNEVLDENIDIKLQYEKYYQAQRGVGVALGQFLPGANINLININATLAILQSVVPTPGDWFAYQASKELNIAEKYTTESIKLNILEGLSEHFINLKHQEKILDSLYEQHDYLEKIYLDAEKKEELGVGTADQTFVAKRDLLQHRQDIYVLRTLMIAEKQALLIALNRSPDEEVRLGDLPSEELDGIPATAEEGTKLALQNSTELISNSYQYEAAQFMVSSKKWSFISFDGIGFSYSSTLAIERSNARIIELQRQQIELKIKNQVHSAYHELGVLDQRLTVQQSIVDAYKKIDGRQSELYDLGLISLSKYVESKINVDAEERALAKLQNERRIKIIQLKRFLGFDSSLSTVDLTKYEAIELVKEEYRARYGAKKVWFSLNVPEELAKDIFSVTYSCPEAFSGARVLDLNNDFTYYFKFTNSGEHKVKADIKLKNGQVITKEITVSIE